jgi:hypothetical protein
METPMSKIYCTRTVAILEIPTAAYDAIVKQIKAAESPGNSYADLFLNDGTLVLTDIGLRPSTALDPKFTWNPLQFPHPGDIVEAWNSRGREERVVVEGRKRPGIVAYIHPQHPHNIFQVQRKSWAAWCRKNNAQLVMGGSNK